MKLNNRLLIVIVAITLSLCGFSAFADESYLVRPDGHAPIGVMRDHVHKKGEYMLSYRYDYMSMKGNKQNSDGVSTQDILGTNGYMMSPSKMDMRMHMVGAMYGITNKLTTMVMANFISTNMKMIDSMNSDTKAAEHVSGFGDTTIDAMYSIFKGLDRHAQLNLGLSVPTGSIRKKNEDGSRVAYVMQTGSGSYEFNPGLSYSGFSDSYSYGAQLNGKFRLNTNNSGYKLGDVYNTTTWVGKKLNEAFSLSSRLSYTITEKTEGYDKAIKTQHTSMMGTMPMGPTTNATFSGGKRLDFLLGANFVVPSGALKGHRLAVEAGTPLYQKVNGIQMRNRYNITVGWQKSF